MSRKRILLVEDHPIMRDACMQVINRSSDVEVCAALATAEEALQQVPELKPDLVLVDVSLPGMSGIDFTVRLRTIDSALPVLIMTGHGDEHYRQDAIKAGASGLVFKHEGPIVLMTAIQDVLEQNSA